MRLEKENNLKAWNMGAIIDTVNDYIRSNGGDKDAARQRLVDDLQNEENKDPQDEKKIEHLNAALDLLGGGPYTNWIEIEAYYTELKFLLTAVRKGFAEYDDVKALIDDVISNCEKHEGGMATGIRSHFTAIDGDATTSDVDKVDQKIQVLDNQLAGIDGNITGMATNYTNLVGDPAQTDIDATGGTLSLTLPGNTSGIPDISITVPAGALAASTTFKIDEQTEYLLAGWIWIYTPASEGFFIHPDALMFADGTPATVTLRYYEGKDASRLDIYQLSPDKPNDGRWQKIDTGRTVNETNRTISVTTTQLGVFAILEDTPWLNGGDTGNGGNGGGGGGGGCFIRMLLN